MCRDELRYIMVDTTPLSLLSLLDDTLALAVTPEGVMSESITRANTFWMRAGMTLDLTSNHSRKRVFETSASLISRQLNSMAYRINYPNVLPAPEINRLVADLSNCYASDISEYDTQLMRTERNITSAGRDISLVGAWAHVGGFPIIQAAQVGVARGRLGINSYFASVGVNAVQLRIPPSVEFGYVRFTHATRTFRLEQNGTLVVLEGRNFSVTSNDVEISLARWVPFRYDEEFTIRTDDEHVCVIIEFCSVIGKGDRTDVLSFVSPVDLANVNRVYRTNDQVSPLGIFFSCVADDCNDLLTRIHDDAVLAFWIFSYMSRIGSLANALRVDRVEMR